jgi:hypothetical protein
MSKPLDNNLIKKPHQAENWTEQQIMDIVQCCDPVNGAHYFCSNFFYIQHPTRGRMLYQPFEFQKKLLKVYNDYRYSIALISRQMGKCFGGETLVYIKNSQSQKQYEIPIELFHQYIRAQQQGLPLPDISNYEKQDV